MQEKKKNDAAVMGEVYKKLPGKNTKQKYKDNLLKIVFNSKKHLLELYNSLNNTCYKDENEILAFTMDEVVFVSINNDVSFMIGITSDLCTLKNNMDLFALLYWPRFFQDYIDSHNMNIYSHSAVKLPFPQNIFLYCGDESIDDALTLKLSDSNPVPEGRDRDSFTPFIECIVNVININHGHNYELSEKCQRMKEFSRFMQILKEYRNSGANKKLAIDMAIAKAIEENLLTDVLFDYKAEFREALLTELIH